jgi:hypothetical protein
VNPFSDVIPLCEVPCSLWFRVLDPWELSRPRLRIYRSEDAMKAYRDNLPTKTWILLVVPAVALAYPIARVVIPAVVHAVVPEVVRSVLSVI